MTQSPENEKEWQEFLRKNRPTPPPATNDLEEQLMQAIAASPAPIKSRKMWVIPSVIAASFLMTLSGYYFLNLSQDSHNYVSLENFMESNWNEVVGEVPNSQSNSIQGDWMLEGNTTQ